MNHPYLVLAIVAFMLWSQRRPYGKQWLRAGFGPLGYVLARWPVMVALAVGGSMALCLLLLAALGRGQVGPYDLFRVAWQSAIAGLSFAAVFVGAPFLLVRAGAKVPPLPLEPEEVLIQERGGRHFLKGESRWGRVLLTSRRIAFRPNRFNIQLDPWSLRLDDLRSVRLEGECLVVLECDAPRPAEWLVVVDGRKLAEQLDEVRRLPEAERRPAA